MPGVHEAAPLTAPQLAPMLPPEDAQFDPLQQRLGRGAVCGVHVRPGAQPPAVSQRQPWVPTMQVDGAPEPELPVPELLPIPEALPLPEPDVPELAPELPPRPKPLPGPPSIPASLPPHAATTATPTTVDTCKPTNDRRSDALFMMVPSFGLAQCVGCAHTSEPCSRMHSEFDTQQSDAAVHGVPSAAQAAAHCSAPSPRLQRPPQQSLGSEHPDASPPQDASVPAAHRSGAPSPAGVQACPPQQPTELAQISPSAPHLPTGWHRKTMFGPGIAAHVPEQHSLLLEQTSHSAEQPPVGAHLLTPSLVVWQERVQQSFAPLQRSPTCAAQGLPSLAMHIGSAAQWPTRSGSRWQDPEQQSVSRPHSSPTGRQATRRTQRCATHEPLQQSAIPPHASPAGWQGGGGGAHLPPMQ
jgi:hypothetical protein